MSFCRFLYFKTHQLIIILAFALSLMLFAYNVVKAEDAGTPYGYGTYGSCAYQECSISINTSSLINLSLTPTEGGVYTIEKDEVEVITNSSKGYTMQLESASDSSSALSPSGGSDTIDSTSGTVAAPSALSGNEWGFRIDGFSGFGSGPTASAQNQSGTSPLFAGLPLLGNPVIIKVTSESTEEEGDLTEVWYGAKADTSIASGLYTGTVVYTATINIE